MGRAEARISGLQARMDEIAREQASIRAALSRIDGTGPKGVPSMAPLGRQGLELVAPTRNGFSIKY